MAFQQQRHNPMDYAKKAGRQRRIADVLQDLELQRTALPGEMEGYSTKKTALDIGTNVASYICCIFSIRNSSSNDNKIAWYGYKGTW